MATEDAEGTERRRLSLSDAARPGYAACSGCGLCLLPCPVWRQTGDVMLTPKGRARALQGGARPEDLAASAAACVLCGGCEPICPERIDTVGMALDLRSASAAWPALSEARQGRAESKGSGLPAATTGVSALRTSGGGRLPSATVLLPGEALAAAPDALAAAVRGLGGGGSVAVAEDDGRDLAADLAAGRPVDPARRARFVRGLAGARELVVADGFLHRFLRRWIARARVTGLGEALLRSDAVRRALSPTDLYVVEPQGYHADFERLVRVYDRLRKETGCRMNLDLHRLAIGTGVRSGSGLPPAISCPSPVVGAGRPLLPVGCVDPRAQVRWILEGLRIERIVVEDAADRDVFSEETGLPVLHVAELP